MELEGATAERVAGPVLATTNVEALLSKVARGETSTEQFLKFTAEVGAEIKGELSKATKENWHTSESTQALDNASQMNVTLSTIVRAANKLAGFDNKTTTKLKGTLDAINKDIRGKAEELTLKTTEVEAADIDLGLVTSYVGGSDTAINEMHMQHANHHKRRKTEKYAASFEMFNKMFSRARPLLKGMVEEAKGSRPFESEKRTENVATVIETGEGKKDGARSEADEKQNSAAGSAEAVKEEDKAPSVGDLSGVSKEDIEAVKDMTKVSDDLAIEALKKMGSVPGAMEWLEKNAPISIDSNLVFHVMTESGVDDRGWTWLAIKEKGEAQAEIWLLDNKNMLKKLKEASNEIIGGISSYTMRIGSEKERGKNLQRAKKAIKDLSADELFLALSYAGDTSGLEFPPWYRHKTGDNYLFVYPTRTLAFLFLGTGERGGPEGLSHMRTVLNVLKPLLDKKLSPQQEIMLLDAKMPVASSISESETQSKLQHKEEHALEEILRMAGFEEFAYDISEWRSEIQGRAGAV